MTEELSQLAATDDATPLPEVENESEVRAQMRALEADAGNWRDHISFEVAVDYYSEEALRTEHSPHVDDCSYCRELLETLHPPEHLVQEFQFAVELAEDNALAGAEKRALRPVERILNLFGVRVA